MAIKVNDFVIQAKVKEGTAQNSSNEQPVASSSGSSVGVPDSVKQEIIDECLEKMNDLVNEKLRG